MRVDQSLIHSGEFARSGQFRIVARGQGAYALADVARGARFYPPDEVHGEKCPEDGGGQYQAQHPHAALPQRIARQARVRLHRYGAFCPAVGSGEGAGHRRRFHVEPRVAPITFPSGAIRTRAPFDAGRIPVVGNAHQGIQALSEQLVRQLRLFVRADRAMGQGPRQRVDARFTLLRQLRVQIAVRRQHPQRLGAKQDEADQKGGA
ncbi:hypothetical protein D3C86_1254840 [compost metagenome]